MLPCERGEDVMAKGRHESNREGGDEKASHHKAMVVCGSCGKKMRASADACPHCKKPPLSKRESHAAMKKGIRLGVIGNAAGVVGATSVLWLAPARIAVAFKTPSRQEAPRGSWRSLAPRNAKSLL